ncbi:MAG: orotidine-5'-phosphate decarboxylase [Verrucomicrobiota bacterium]|nr:orotidine-5'-phosphate decarboxylase [Verrucomicrobiota bacterium]
MKTELIVALDADKLEVAEKIVEAAGDNVKWYKVGKQLFTLYGPKTIEMLKNKGKKVFLDLKFHDIPNTVGGAIQSAGAIGADMVNIHASGGSAMMKAAADSAKSLNKDMILIAVTVLTSIDDATMKTMGFSCSPGELALSLAKLAKANNIAGVVASAWEIKTIKEVCGKDFLLIVPGIRPAGSAKDDQKRVMTPRQASEAGADYIVVGRPVTQADNPAEAAKKILEELDI